MRYPARKAKPLFEQNPRNVGSIQRSQESTVDRISSSQHFVYLVLLSALMFNGCVPSSQDSNNLLNAAQAGDVEAQRQLANQHKPGTAFGVETGDEDKALRWYRKTCKANYANGQVDFYDFASVRAQSGGADYLAEAIECLNRAIMQGHREAIVNGAFQAAFIDMDYELGYFRYALLEEALLQQAKQRQSFTDKLSTNTIERLEDEAAAWRQANQVKSYDDFFRVINSPFRRMK